MQFDSSRDAIGVDALGNSLVLAGDEELFKFDSAGMFVGELDTRDELLEVPEGFMNLWNVTTDEDGNFYVTGSTDGVFPGEVGRDPSDQYQNYIIGKFDSNMESVWIRRYQNIESGSVMGVESVGYDIALDGEGNIYVSGVTNGTFTDAVETEDDPDDTNATFNNLFIAKHAPSGERLWSNEFAITSLPHIVVSGDGDVFGINQTTVLKLSSDGETEWLRTREDWTDSGQFFLASLALSPDASSVYLTGSTRVDVSDAPTFMDIAGLDRDNSFLLVLDSTSGEYESGMNQLSGRTLSTCSNADECFGTSSGDSVVVTTGGAIVVAGTVTGFFAGTSQVEETQDAFIAVYSGADVEPEIVQFGTDEGDSAEDAALDPWGRAVILGRSSGDFGMKPSSSANRFLAVFDVAVGELL